MSSLVRFQYLTISKWLKSVHIERVRLLSCSMCKRVSGIYFRKISVPVYLDKLFLFSVKALNFISSKSRILIKISSKHKHSILMKKFDVFAPAFTSKLTLRIFFISINTRCWWKKRQLTGIKADIHLMAGKSFFHTSLRALERKFKQICLPFAICLQFPEIWLAEASSNSKVSAFT